MSGFLAKTYQQQVLDSVEAYFRACHELPSPSVAFTATTERAGTAGPAQVTTARSVDCGPSYPRGVAGS